ncbi:hypothetical protein [Nesterenkonia suensis]
MLAILLPHDHGPAPFSGDTLVQDDPGATGRPSSFETIISSIRDRIVTDLPAQTETRTGDRDTTRVDQERPHLQDWIDRGR